MQLSIDKLIGKLSATPFDPKLSLTIAEEYANIGQTASAVSFYLRTAEYGYKTHPQHVYASLLKSSSCFATQTNRKHTVLNLILKAIAYAPQRPEAWLYLSQWYEREQKWQESYTAAEVGLSFAKKKIKVLPLETAYLGEYTLVFQKAVSAWWVGRKDESIDLFEDLKNQPIAPNYLAAVLSNLSKIK